MMKALKVLAAAGALCAVTAIGATAQAAPSTGHAHAGAMTAQTTDTGWG